MCLSNGSDRYAEAQLAQSGDVDILIGETITNAFPFEPIPEAVDVDGDGVEEVLVIRNRASLGGVLPNRTRFSTGDIALLRAGPYGYNLSPVSPKFASDKPSFLSRLPLS